MPHLDSFSGFKLLLKYLSNWYLVIALYANIINTVKIKFRDGFEVKVSKRKNEIVNTLNEGFGFKGSKTWLQNSTNFALFFEEIYKRYLKDNGFNYQTNLEKTIVTTPSGIRIVIIPPYSFILDEIFVMKVYGEPDLRGRIVIDIGASIGDSSLYFSSLGATKVYGFEIDKERFTMASGNIEINNLKDKIEFFNEAATAKSVAQLILKNNYHDVFIKLDCEGCEYEILRDLAQEIYVRIGAIVMEFHQDPKPLIEKLRNLNYKVSVDKTIISARR
jgi:hypothetical protein